VTRIGISPRLFHPEQGARGVHTKLLDYLEHSVGEWVASRGALVFLLPLSERAADYAQALDGLVLQGGADISPLAYGEQPQKPEWAGDEMRDRYEIDLVQAFARAGKPVLGICRGAQLINVALGGSLHQDVPAHRTDDYDLHAHDVRLEPGSGLAPDGLIEAIRSDGPNYVCAVQWHPEFHGGREGFLDGGPLLDEFLEAARK
jgi:putative glutamine amidotransferase